MKKFTLLFLAALAVAGAALAEEPKPLTESQKKDIVIAYQNAIIHQQAAIVAQAQFKAATDQYATTVSAVLKADGYPEGTNVRVDMEKGDVQIVPAPPQKPQEKK